MTPLPQPRPPVRVRPTPNGRLLVIDGGRKPVRRPADLPPVIA